MEKITNLHQSIVDCMCKYKSMTFLLRSDRFLMKTLEASYRCLPIAISSYLPSVFRFVYRLASPSSFDIYEATYFFPYLSTTKAMWLNYHPSPTWSSLIEAFKAILSNFQPCIASLGKLLVAFPCSTPTYHKNPDLFGQERKLPQVHIGLHSFTHHRFISDVSVGRYTPSINLWSLMWVDNWYVYIYI